MAIPADKTLARRVHTALAALPSRLSPSRRASNAPHPAHLQPPTHPALPILPPEVWLLIIREATLYAPDPLGLGLGAPSFLSPTEGASPGSSSGTAQHRAYRTALRTKRTLALVNKQWSALIQPYLYEFIWLSSAAQAKALALTLLTQFVQSRPISGIYIKRLHLETPALRRCATDDVRTILEYAPGLIAYADQCAVRCARALEWRDVRSSPEEMVAPLGGGGRKLRRLSITNYGDAPFPLHVSPVLRQSAAQLEYLELSSASIPLVSPFALGLALGAFSTDNVTGVPGGLEEAPVVHLPVLQSLKLTLDNTTFAVLARWDMPSLRNVCVTAADYAYAGAGFARFFEAHGERVRQLELGHSSALLEEAGVVLTPLPALGGAFGNGGQGQTTNNGNNGEPVGLATWCPNLDEFICSADAAWNWRRPDWIAPHVLLPSHPTLSVIGIRDIDTRMADDAAAFPVPSHYGATGHGVQGDGDDEDGYGVESEDAPFFPLVEQIGSLLHGEAFPSLRCIRDLSRASAALRVGARRSAFAPDVSPRAQSSVAPAPLKAKKRQSLGSGLLRALTTRGSRSRSRTHPQLTTLPELEQLDMADALASSPALMDSYADLNMDMDIGPLASLTGPHGRPQTRVLKMWARILARCGEHGVWLEDWRGVNVTRQDLRRAGLVAA
ncbi:hypothetical protein CONPUDRAFT_160846 [Coniophora puteana RWD-64-598 SS2]|uniref:Uncharacterized protein n=1 Tax=Coniophora puteana (strain RWD-64-598) TaxID=741705 RepID=A0A5M3N3J9_CONPW|nr:uncharacterized protein CONPUDRAFT_160846 [Coniophora puteana RWD-64-598 SS2]EIW85928.1 hypothetical protein CONPUDRAFT_160846 [Coniophora puteana RWD-64-598 SS2]